MFNPQVKLFNGSRDCQAERRLPFAFAILHPLTSWVAAEGRPVSIEGPEAQSPAPDPIVGGAPVRPKSGIERALSRFVIEKPKLFWELLPLVQLVILHMTESNPNTKTEPCRLSVRPVAGRVPGPNFAA